MEYPEQLWSSYNELRFFPEKKNNIKCEKHLYNLNSKENYIGHIRSLKKAINNGLNLQKVHNIIILIKNNV